MPPVSKQFGLPLNLKKVYKPVQESRYGIPIKSAKEAGLDDFFSKNTETAGMVWGKGNNGSPMDEPLSIIVNPYNKYMKDANNKESLIKNEASRILMTSNPVPKYSISPQLQKWRESTFNKNDPYLNNDDAFRETVVARVLTGDSGPDPKNPMPVDKDTKILAEKYNKMLSEIGNKPMK